MPSPPPMPSLLEHSEPSPSSPSSTSSPDEMQVSLRVASLSASKAVNRIDKWSKALVHLKAYLKVLVLLLLLMQCKDLGVIPSPG